MEQWRAKQERRAAERDTAPEIPTDVMQLMLTMAMEQK